MVASRLLALPDLPTAIFAYSDRWAVGCDQAIRAAGLMAGRDVSVVGFDDIVMTEWVDPPLTTVRQPRLEMGRIAIDLLLNVLNGKEAPEVVVVQPDLVVRGSTGPIRGLKKVRT